MRQMAAMSGMAVRMPVSPAGMESVALTADALNAACWMSALALFSGSWFSAYRESGMFVMRSKRMLVAFYFSMLLV